MTVPNAALDQARKDVPVDSSPTENDTLTDQSAADNNPAPDAGKKSGHSDATDAGGRDIDNVRHELVRKLDKSDSTLRAEIAELKGMLAGLMQGNAAPTTSAAPDVANMTAAQLAALEGDVPAEQKS